MSRVPLEIRQGFRLVEQEFRQAPVPLAQIAGGTGRHYVAAGAVPATQLRLHVIHGQLSCGKLYAAVHAAPLVPDKDFLAVHDG